MGYREWRKERNGPKAGAINLFYIRKPGRSENKNYAAATGGEEEKKAHAGQSEGGPQVKRIDVRTERYRERGREWAERELRRR